MEFFCELGAALGKSLAEVMALSVAELNVWRAFRERRGFPADRCEWATLNGSAYVGSTWGGKAKPRDLAPKFQRQRVRQASAAETAAFKAWFEARAVNAGK